MFIIDDLFNFLLFGSGYMSPEYAMFGQFSVKSDVFSFGVIILEIVSGKRNVDFNGVNSTDDLLSHVGIILLIRLQFGLLFTFCNI